jgi:hypothetical protein
VVSLISYDAFCYSLDPMLLGLTSVKVLFKNAEIFIFLFQNFVKSADIFFFYLG